jgi:hypothetical protein
MFSIAYKFCSQHFMPKFTKAELVWDTNNPPSVFRRIRKIARSLVMFVRCFARLSVRMKKLGSHSTDFNKIYY